VRIAHATDIHWTSPLPLSRVFGKRLLGGLNLVLGGRRYAFAEAVQRALVDHIVALEPDAVFLTGDLTSFALEAEFAKARADLQPVLDRFPTLVLPGNHDVYTRGAARQKRIQEYFRPWMGLDGNPGAVARLDVGPLTLLGLDPNHPGLLSTGFLPPAQLQGLEEVLRSPGLADRRVILGLHYPVVDRSGRLYVRFDHRLRNVADLVAVLEAAPVRPVAILHGHVHHGYRSELRLGEDRVPVFDAGSGGLAPRPEHRRSACMNLYEVGDDGSIEVERFVYGATGFQPEPGGPYTSGY
jgi:3',5'-cyclic AMP phosphodiesterase CpdA